MTSIRALFVAWACLLCAVAQAQWQWIDKDGRKVFSDRAPPSDIPVKSIVKQPGGNAGTSVTAAAPAANTAGAAASAPGAAAGLAVPAADAPKLASVDKDLEARKKQAEAAAAAKVKAEEERVAKARMENCEKARAGKAVIDSGVRITVTNAKGEREVLEDAGRAAQLRNIQQAITANCSRG